MSAGEAARVSVRSAPIVGQHLVDGVFAVLAGWLMAGVSLDAWAHGAGLPDSFWTPWHGVLYSGLLACGAFLVVARIAERSGRGRLLAPGYELSLVGVGIAALGGIADAIWHTVLGVEFNVDAAVSPSHLAIVAGILLVVSGPARVAWTRRASFGLPAALGLLYALSILTVIVSYATPFSMVLETRSATFETRQLEQVRAIFAFSAYAALLSGLAVVALRRVAIGPAAFGLLLGGNAAALTAHAAPRLGGAVGPYLAVAVVSAGAVSAVAAWLRPGPARPGALRAFAVLLASIPAALYAVVVPTAIGTDWGRPRSGPAWPP